MAKLVEPNHEVEILGPTLGDGIWGPVKDEFDYKSIGTDMRIFDSKKLVERSFQKVTGDVIYASKPRMSSYGTALFNRFQRDIPVILDIDDWETGFRHEWFGTIHRYPLGLINLLDLNSFYYTKFLEKYSAAADAITVSNSFLQDKFGGTVIPHVRDTDKFDPKKYDKFETRSDLGLPLDKKIIMFSGTPLPHKGVHDLVKAVRDLPSDDVVTVIVGADQSEYTAKLSNLGGESVIIRGQQPFSEIPKWISTADVIAIPQRESASNGQIPAKVFDAMAMGKPIVASNMSDLDRILDECGIVIEPGSLHQLSDAIESLTDNPEYAAKLGENARTKCIEEYSYQATAPVIDKIVREVAD
ncbi:glycosyltransferase family 4 protein [Halogeometricum borinquense]|nr:glycosyltransferase family 4 protein [Halogeometricum borinquense]